MSDDNTVDSPDGPPRVRRRAGENKKTAKRLTSDLSSKKGEIKDKTILCYSPRKAREGQVDLFPRAWCCGGGCDQNGGEDDDDDCEEEEGKSFCDILWRVCFYLFCFPICYPCYVSR